MEKFSFDPAALAQRFRPVYHLHSEEMWYPCHPEDQLRCANLVSVADGSIVIPAIGETEGSPSDQLLGTPLGLQQLSERGIHPDSATVDALQWASTASPHYAALLPNKSFLLKRADDQFLPPYGWIDSTNFQPSSGTWFHRGAPNNPLTWLGGDPSTYASAILSPSPGISRGAWQEPTAMAWVQNHTVAGTAYVDVIYTCFLGWNGSISILPGQGEHPNDVETVTVRFAATNLDQPVRFFFQQHGGMSWYEPPYVERSGDRIVVYLARESHECYPHPGRFGRLYGAADDLCDARGVTWDAPVQYVNRPQGVDQNGVDTDALRCSVSADSPNDVILVPLDNPGPLWQYVRFLFLARRPETVPLTDEDFTHQPFPLATSKWWPDEGPAGSSPPLSEKAAEPSAAGVPAGFFTTAAPYLGPNPLPTCSSVEAESISMSLSEVTSDWPEYASTQTETVLGRDIGGGAAALAPDATFVDWRGGIGAYLLGSVNAHLPGWLQLLPDPFTITNIVAGDITIEKLEIQGFHGLIVTPVVARSATNVHLLATTPQLDCAATLSFKNGPSNVAASLVINTVTLEVMATLITPVAIPASDYTQWYVPYVGPLPYSYATEPFPTTSQISNGTIEEIKIAFTDITVDVGNSALNFLIDAILATLKQTIENDLSAALQNEVNSLLAGIYDGTMRVA